MFAFNLLLPFLLVTFAFAHPLSETADRSPFTRAADPSTSSELNALLEGNKQFRQKIEADSPGLLKTLALGQEPPFLYIGCSDSRVSEGTLFNAKPGTLFTQRNIANQFHASDANAHSTLSYAVSDLGVTHILMVGHYGCGGVAASIASPPAAPVSAADASLQAWIGPIRELYQTSTRPEIVAMREQVKSQPVVEAPEIGNPGFRALVEENVKAGVHRIASDPVITNHYALLSSPQKRADHGEHKPIHDVFVHGLVYDLETGEVKNLNVSVGPPGKAIPTVPFETVKIGN
ncbi:carbonic anhydrase [Infundibulicybe gibba]|nr:carbonic anhydrase [Infundibulicybe gibba]